jgi:hypothetical protein
MSHSRLTAPRYQHRIAFRLSTVQLGRLRQAADATDARVSEIVRAAVGEKLTAIEEGRRR